MAFYGPLAIGDVHPRDDRKVRRHLVGLSTDGRGSVGQFNGSGCSGGSPSGSVRFIARLPRSILGTN